MNEELLAPCGLYCGVCGVFLASRDNNQRLKERLAPAYGVSPEQIECKGCLSGDRFAYCESCSIRSCVSTKNYEGCHECEEFPCGLIQDFPVPTGKNVMLRAVPSRRELGTERWVEQEETRYICPHCGSKLFRGSRRCRSCKEPVNVD